MAVGLISHSRIDEIIINIHPDDFASEFIKYVDTRFESSYVFHRNIFKRKIDFKGSVFRFVWNGWNVFNTISNGEIEFESKGESTYINHKIYFTEIFTISFLFSIIPLTMGGEWPLRLLVFSLIWLVYIASYLIGVYRFNSFISNALIHVNLIYKYENNTDEENMSKTRDEFEDEKGIG